MATKKEQAADVEAPEQPSVTFTDKVFRSRTLVLPGDRQLPVSKAAVTVLASDAVAVDFLTAHADFEQKPE